MSAGTAEQGAGHRTVMRREAVGALNIRADGCYVDGTYGAGGHSSAILEQLGPRGRLLVIDKDPGVIAKARERHRGDPRVSIYHGGFSRCAAVLDGQFESMVDGLLLDLGVSSMQLDTPERGFSFRQSAPLDMRMDTSRGETVADWLARVEQQELADVIWRYGEERRARRIAAAIIAARERAALRTTGELAQVIASASPGYRRHHPATQTFQALRIHINGELEELRIFLDSAVPRLAPGGRLVVISFHSLEDRLVKRFIQAHSTSPGPAQAGDLPGPLRRVRWRKKPSDAEMAENRRARSARLRVAERTDRPWLGEVAGATGSGTTGRYRRPKTVSRVMSVLAMVPAAGYRHHPAQRIHARS